tara:strand:+ start:39522 stop:39830 length:309 start_codon:yes stop_codon:yes gene_type:complete
MAKNSPFTLTFTEALEIVMKGGWVQGQNFRNGLILMKEGNLTLSGLNHVHVHDFLAEEKDQEKIEFFLSSGIYMDKYRQISTAYDAKNKPEVNALTGLVIES